MMRFFLKVVLCIGILCFFVLDIKAQEVKPGYSEWSTEKSSDQNEESAIQYGRLLPKEWSEWSLNKEDTLFQKEKAGDMRFYSYDGEAHFWNDARAKTLYTWDFKHPEHIHWFYIDVDVYQQSGYTNYSGPPLQLYCDNKLIASTGAHNELQNWSGELDCDCTLATLKMSSYDSGRDKTAIVGTWLETDTTLFAFVKKWDDGSGWRFDEPYEIKYGEESQIPTSRVVYSHPLVYTIDYDLSDGKPDATLPKTYTVLDEKDLPDVSKEGYVFKGFYDENDVYYPKIEKGTTGDLVLHAVFERKKPVLNVGFTYFLTGPDLLINDLLKQVNANAEDELDGDLSSKIIVEKIKYKDHEEIRPDRLKLDSVQEVEITFSVSNSGDKTVYLSRTYQIIDPEQKGDIYNDLKVYERFIDRNHLSTFEEGSVWQLSDYREQLMNAFAFLK